MENCPRSDLVVFLTARCTISITHQTKYELVITNKTYLEQPSPCQPIPFHLCPGHVCSAANEEQARYNVLTLRGSSGAPVVQDWLQAQSIQILEHGFDIVLSPKLSEEFLCAALSDVSHRRRLTHSVDPSWPLRRQSAGRKQFPHDLYNNIRQGRILV